MVHQVLKRDEFWTLGYLRNDAGMVRMLDHIWNLVFLIFLHLGIAANEFSQLKLIHSKVLIRYNLFFDNTFPLTGKFVSKKTSFRRCLPFCPISPPGKRSFLTLGGWNNLRGKNGMTVFRFCIFHVIHHHNLICSVSESWSSGLRVRSTSERSRVRTSVRTN